MFCVFIIVKRQSKKFHLSRRFNTINQNRTFLFNVVCFFKQNVPVICKINCSCIMTSKILVKLIYVDIIQYQIVNGK